MKKELAFQIPFSGFAGTTFINCFASMYLFLENIKVTGEAGYRCDYREKGHCSQCGSCRKTPVAMQERYFFVFDTMCGCSSLRWRFDGTPTQMQLLISDPDYDDGGTDNNVEFLFGFAGYEYQQLTDPSVFREKIKAAIDTGKPILVRVKSGGARFRVITGYDADTLICPDFGSAQTAPCYEELDVLYIIGKKTAPRYTFLDGLKRIRRVMEYNQEEKLWDGYMEKIGLYGPEGLGEASLEEKKVRMKRVADTMWFTFNSHNFAEVFRQRNVQELKSPVFDEICRKIGAPLYGYTHDLAWSVIGLEECADWGKHYAGYWGEMVQLTLRQIRDNDSAVLEEVKRMIEILEEQR